MSKKQILAVVATMSFSFALGLCVLAFLLANHYGTYYAGEAETVTQSLTENVKKENTENFDEEAKKPAEEKKVEENSKEESSEKEPAAIAHKTENEEKLLKTEEKSLEEIAKLKANIVVVSSGQALGSGVLISKNGYIVTNYHVVQNGAKCSISFEDQNSKQGVGPKIPATLVKHDKEKDIALLKINRAEGGYIQLGDSEGLKVGEKIVTIGNPQGLVNTVADGIVSNFRKMEKFTLVQISSPITHGSSGGALLNMKGELVGITMGGIEGQGNLNFAVSASDIKKFLAGTSLQ